MSTNKRVGWEHSLIALAVAAMIVAVLAFVGGMLFERGSAAQQQSGQTAIEQETEPSAYDDSQAGTTGDGEQNDSSDAQSEDTESQNTQGASSDVVRGQYYYDLEHVVLYLDAFGELPDNYVTKSEASAAGWSGGSPERYIEGAAIGGDTFRNREGQLPQGPNYTEADIDTQGKSKRGAKRLVFSDDGHYYYTADHYDSFTEVFVENGQVIWDD